MSRIQSTCFASKLSGCLWLDLDTVFVNVENAKVYTTVAKWKSQNDFWGYECKIYWNLIKCCEIYLSYERIWIID